MFESLNGTMHVICSYVHRGTIGFIKIYKYSLHGSDQSNLSCIHTNIFLFV